MNLNFFIKKNHIFKKRKFKNLFKINFKNYHYCKGLYNAIRYKIELVYLRYFRKIFKKRKIRKKSLFFRPKYWQIIKPNFIFTKKSKNARMGAGVGKFIRICFFTRRGKPLVLTKFFSNIYLKKAKNYLYFKFNIKVFFKTKKYNKFVFIIV